MADTRPTLIFQSPLWTRSGYGSHSRSLLYTLWKMDKFDISIIPTRWGACPMNVTESDTAFGQWMLSHIAPPQLPKPDVFIQVSVANEFEAKGFFNIGVTAGVETTVAPLNFIEGCNKMEIVIVPSEFTRNVLMSTLYQKKDQNNVVLEEYRITKPVIVLQEGVEASIYDKATSTSILDDIPQDFCYLVVAHALKGISGQDRKDLWMTIKTFATVFQSVPKDKQPALILKTSSAGFSIGERDALQEKINDVLHSIGDKCPPIYLVYGDLSDQEMSNLYHAPKVKAMLSFTKGEGYGRPLAEFTLTGKPILVSKWSGQLDFLPPDNTVFLEGTLTPVHESVVDQFLIKESQWFTVNYSLAGAKMFDVYKNYAGYLSKSAALRTNTLKKFTMTQMHDQFTQIMDTYVKPKPKVVPFTLPKLTKI